MRPFFTFFVAALLAAAAEPGWMTKRVPQWSADDLKQILTSSPWAKPVTPQVVPPLDEYHPQQTGNTRGATGVGLPVAPGGVNLASSGGNAGPEPVATASNGRGRVLVRWESALPMRAAEMKSRVAGVPDWDGDRYAIVVYDVPFVPQSKQKAILADIKRVTVLKRDGKKDLRAASVEVFPHAGGLATFLYLFSRADEITAADKNVTFLTQIDDLAVSQTFDLKDMVFEGRLEL